MPVATRPRALYEGGLRVIEVTFRTAAAGGVDRRHHR